MKKISYIISGSIGLLIVIGGLFIACKKENTLVVAPAQAHFVGNRNQAYFITTAAATPYKITVGTTDVSTSDRTITFKLSSNTGAVSGTHYTLSGVSGNTIVIPAGKATADITVQGIFTPYNNTGRKDSLMFVLSAPSVDPAKFSDTVKLLLRGPCFDGDVTLSEMGGDYANSNDPDDAVYTATVTNLTTLTPTTGTGKIANLWDVFTPVTINFDWTDPTNTTVSIPLQAAGLDYDAGQPFLIRTSPGQVNKFSICNGRIDLIVDLIVDNYPAPGSAAYYEKNYRMTILR